MVDSPAPFILGGFLMGVAFTVLVFCLFHGWGY